MFTGTLNYVKTLLYCNFPTWSALEVSSICYTAVVLGDKAESLAFLFLSGQSDHAGFPLVNQTVILLKEYLSRKNF